MANKLDIELRRHTGTRNHIVGNKQVEVEVKFNQYSILVNGIEMGLVGSNPGEPVNLLAQANIYQKDDQDRIAEIVKAKLIDEEKIAGEPRFTAYPPTNEQVAAANEAITNQAAKENSLDDDASEQNL